MVQDLSKWPYSSYPDYAGLRNGTLCDKELFFALTGLTTDDVIIGSQAHIDEKDIEKFY